MAYVIKGIDYWRDIEFSEVIETAFGTGQSSIDRRDMDESREHTSDWRRKHGWRDDAYDDLVSRCVTCLRSGHVNEIRRVHITFCA